MGKLKGEARVEDRTVLAAVVFFLVGAVGGYLAFRQQIDSETKEALLTAAFGLPAVALGAYLAFRLEAERVRRVERQAAFTKAILAYSNLVLMGNRLCNVLIDLIGPAQVEFSDTGKPLYLGIGAVLPISPRALAVPNESLAFLLEQNRDNFLAEIGVAVNKYEGLVLEIDRRSTIWLESLKPQLITLAPDGGIPIDIDRRLPAHLVAEMHHNTDAMIDGTYGALETIRSIVPRLADAIHEAFPETAKRKADWPEIPPRLE